MASISTHTTAANSMASHIGDMGSAAKVRHNNEPDALPLRDDHEKQPEDTSEPETYLDNQPINPMDPSQFPDGGLKAWLVVFGGFVGLFVSFGWINCVGVFQEYYQNHQLKDYTSQQVAWIPSLEGSVMFLGGLAIGRAYDSYGPRYILLAGAFFHVFGLMMASLSTEYYQFILSQGICSPLGTSMIFYPCVSATATWFHRRRALALGIVATGSSIGGVVFPIMVQKLIPEVGFEWTMRICGFMILGLAGITQVTVKSRLPPNPKPVRVDDFTAPFTEASFVLLAFGAFLLFLGIFLPFTFIIVAGRARGVPDDLAIYLVPILNAASCFGRTVPNYFADKYGRITTFVISCFASAVVILGLWVPTSGTGAIMTFTVLFGFTSGASVSLLPACLAQISEIRQIGLRNGLLFAFVAVAVLIGSPIGGQLISDNEGTFTIMQSFSGALVAGGSLIFLVLWIRLGGYKRGSKI